MCTAGFAHAANMASYPEKATPVSADLVLISDSEASNATKNVQIGNLPSSVNTVEFAYSDASATDTGLALRIPTSAAWTTAYSRCDGAEAALVYTLNYHATGGTLASIGTIEHDAAATTDSKDISAFTDPVAGGWISVDITTAATTATSCTLAIDLINN